MESVDQAEALVNTLQIEGASLSDANLSSLSSSDLEQLADLQAELDSIDSSVEEIQVKQMLDGDIVDTEIGGEEVVIETEEYGEEEEEDDDEDEDEEILPDIKQEATVVHTKFDESSGVPPPLRPLTIAPKPPPAKVPMALKTQAVVNSGSGQQIVLIQSPGGALAGQQIKLLTSQGQSVSIPGLQNVQLSKQVASGQIMQLRALPKGAVTDAGALGATQLKTVKKIVPQNKNIVAKVIMGTNQGQVVQLSGGTGTSAPQAAKTITLAQAQQMGLIPGGKVQQIVPQSPTKQTLIVNKAGGIQTKTLKMVSQMNKSPTKILPAPQAQNKKPNLQRVIIKQGNQLKTVSAPNVQSSVNQVIRLPAGHTLSSAAAGGQIHQITLPGGKGVQYIRFMPATQTNTGSTASATVVTSKELNLDSNTKLAQLKKSPVPVAGISVNRTGAGAMPKIPVSAGSTFKVVPLSMAQTRPVAPKPMSTISTTQRVLIPASSAQTRTAQTFATIPANALSQIQGTTLIPSSNNMGQIVMLPAQYVQQQQTVSTVSTPVSIATATTSMAMAKNLVPKVPVKQQVIKSSTVQTKDSNQSTTPPANAPPTPPDPLVSSPSDSNTNNTNYSRTLEPNGIRPRKPCNCTKSLCLKLYCDCFANGEFCYMCNCMNCYNNLEKEEERQRAIRNCLERNPNAFRPKIGKGRDAGEASIRKHTKGCNCKRSGCLKNYCECYEAKIACSSNCKCFGCRNIEDSMEKKHVRPLAAMPEHQQLQVVPTTKSKLPVRENDITTYRPLINTTSKLPASHMTENVIEATSHCLIVTAGDAERNMIGEEAAKRLVLEEFGRCLVEIIQHSRDLSNDPTNHNS